MSVNIQSVINNTTWYIAIEVINSVHKNNQPEHHQNMCITELVPIFLV